MSFKLKVRSGGGPSPIKPGTYPAVNVGIVDIGSHPISYEGQGIKIKRQCVFCFAIPAQKPDNPELLYLIKQFTMSLHESSALRKCIEAWQSITLKEDADFDILNLLGQSCNITVTRNDDDWPQIEAITAAPKKQKSLTPPVTPFNYSINQWDRKSEIKVPSWFPSVYGATIEEKIFECKEAGKIMMPPTGKAAHPVTTNGESAPW